MIDGRRYDTDLDTKFDMTAGEDAEITEVSFSNLDALMIQKGWVPRSNQAQSSSGGSVEGGKCACASYLSGSIISTFRAVCLSPFTVGAPIRIFDT